MLIKPVIDQIKKLEFFQEVKISKNLPSLDDLRKGDISLPLCYLLPVKDTGKAISSDAKPQQGLEFLYSICIVTKAGDVDGIEEPPMSFAKEQLLNALLGFSINQYYMPMAFVAAEIKDIDTTNEIWVAGYQAERVYRKKVL